MRAEGGRREDPGAAAVVCRTVESRGDARGDARGGLMLGSPYDARAAGAILREGVCGCGAIEAEACLDARPGAGQVGPPRPYGG